MKHREIFVAVTVTAGPTARLSLPSFCPLALPLPAGFLGGEAGAFSAPAPDLLARPLPLPKTLGALREARLTTIGERF